MFENIREDYRIHGRSLKNRAFWAMAVYRFGVWSNQRRFRLTRWLTSKCYGLMKMVSEIVTGVDLDRGVKLGKGFHIVHPGMVYIHPETVFGDRCGVMHNVTIGTNMGAGVPVIGNDVFIGTGACVLGKVRIGDNVRIAANSLVITDVPADSVAIGVPAKICPSFDRLRGCKKQPGTQKQEATAQTAPAEAVPTSQAAGSKA